jgi:quercetin dioxygenase-like cupin family protein
MLDQSKQAFPTYSFTVNSTTINTFHIDLAGEGHPKHVHEYDHVTLVHSGRLLVTTENNGTFEMTKDYRPVRFPANQWHELEAMEDGTVFTNVFGAGQEGQRPPADM